MAEQKEDPDSLLSTIRELVRLRRDHLRVIPVDSTEVIFDSYPLTFLRGEFLITVNPAATPAGHRLPSGTWEAVHTSGTRIDIDNCLHVDGIRIRCLSKATHTRGVLMNDQIAAAESLLEDIRESQYRRLIEQSERAHRVGRDRRSHLMSLGQIPPGQQQMQPISLTEAATIVRDAVSRSHPAELEIVAVQTIREFACRLTDDDETADYARALSDLALALSMREDPSVD
ncbi:MAG TPA: hypothetical protein VFC19_11555 [Candidatus Limnocylindrales bacterium]|nr:hypothetical protein [Candidatus Limnocylindrales bacterium]